MDQQQRRTLLEACRPGDVDDGLTAEEALELRELLAHDADLAAEFQRVCQWDASIAGALEDVPVPSDLAQRLQAKVAAELAASPATTVAARPTVAPPAPQRRGWLIGIAALAATLLVGVGLWSYLDRPAVVEKQALAQEIQNLLASQAWPESLSSDLTMAPQERLPSVVRGPVYQWGRVPTSLDREAVAFSLVRPGAPQAMVIAMHSPGAKGNLPSEPGLTPTSSTGGVSIGVWQQEPHVFALVVEGNAARYRLFLSNHQRPLAFAARN